MAENELVVEEKKPLTFSESLNLALMDSSGALPVDFNKERFVQNAIALLNDNDQLKNYAKQYGTTQIKLGLMKSAILGLSALNKECYLIPYGPQLNFMVDYRGATKLCRKYSVKPIKEIYAKVVREGDEFQECIVDGHESFTFKPLPFNDGAIVGAFAVCLYEDGTMLIDVMTKKQIDTTKSKARTKNVWNDFEEEMTKKTVLHRLTKHIQIDFDNAEQRKYFEEDNLADFREEPQKASLNDLMGGE